MPKPAPSFATCHPYEAVVNDICYGYFSNPTAAADTARYWAAKLAREQSLQPGSAPPEAKQKRVGIVIHLADDQVNWRSGKSPRG